MPQLSEEGRRAVADIAARHGVSPEAARALLEALLAGGGRQAQFSHPELGGMGQWSQGGMTMVGDMFNNTLKARVDGLCTELAALLARAGVLEGAPAQSQSQSQGGGAGGVSLFVPGSGGGWWPAGLGTPATVGAQNDLRYAWFPEARRLAIDIGGTVRLFDTGEHRISGASQQQGPDRTLTLISQFGTVRLADLAAADGAPAAAWAGAPAAPSAVGETVGRAPSAGADEAPAAALAASAPAAPAAARAGPPAPAAGETPPADRGGDDVFAKIERLAELRRKDILTDEEFAAKKAELLARL